MLTRPNPAFDSSVVTNRAERTTRLTDTTLKSEESSDLRRMSENVGEIQVDNTEDRIVLSKARVSNDDSDDSFLPISNEDLSSGFVERHCRVSVRAISSAESKDRGCEKPHCLTRVLKTMLSLTIIWKVKISDGAEDWNEKLTSQ